MRSNASTSRKIFGSFFSSPTGSSSQSTRRAMPYMFTNCATRSAVHSENLFLKRTTTRDRFRPEENGSCLAILDQWDLRGGGDGEFALEARIVVDFDHAGEGREAGAEVEGEGLGRVEVAGVEP